MFFHTHLRAIRFSALALLAAVLLSLFSHSAVAREVIVGLRAHNGIEAGLKQWQPTIDFMNKKIDGYTFTLLPYENLNELSLAANLGTFDYIITNPSSYVEMEINSGASRMLTLINKRQGKPYTEFGSVIFARAGRIDLNTIEDLRGKTLMATSEPAFGGWRVAWGELLKHGMDPYKDLKKLSFAGGIQSNVVFSVRDGAADAGVVRTDMLERMAADGKIDLKEFRVVGQKESENFPFLRSTDLYPEWVFAEFPGAQTDLSQRVAHFLLEITADAPAAMAGKYVGWSVPLNYQSVHELLKTLKVGPYKDYGKVTLKDALLTYRYWVIALAVVLLALFAAITVVFSRTREMARLRADMLAERDRELDFQRLALDEHAIVSITNVRGAIIHANDKFCDISGYSREELIGQNHRMLKSGDHPREFYDDLWGTISSGRTWHGEIKNMKRDGAGYYWVKATIVPFLNKAGKPFKYVAIRTDITERKETEIALRKHTDHVELMHGVTTAASLYTDSDQAMQSILEYICGHLGWPVAHIYLVSADDPDLLVPSDIWNYGTEKSGEFTAFRDLTMESQFNKGIGLPGRVLETGEPVWMRNISADSNFPRATTAKACGIRTGFALPVKVGGRTRAVLEFFSTEAIEADDDRLRTLQQVGDQIGRVIERKRATEDMARREQQFRDFGAAASDWYWEMDKNLRFSYFSDSFTVVSGVSQDLLLGKTRQENGNPGAEPDAWQEHLKTLAAHRPFRNFVHPSIQSNDTVVWLSINGKPVFDENGNFSGYRGTGMDVTEAVEAQQGLVSLSAAIDAMSEPVVVFDDEDRFLFTNEAYRTLNTPVAETIRIGERFEDHVKVVANKGLSPDAVGREDDWIAERLKQHRNPSGPIELKRQDGTWFLGTEKKLPSGGQVLLLTDISGIKKTQDDLIAARNEAETANLAKSEFLSSMSHELRTPMNAILGFGQMLTFNPAEPLTKVQQESVDHILKGGNHLLNLINDVLDLAKIEAGKVELSIEPISMKEVIDECLTLVEKMAEGRNISIAAGNAASAIKMVQGDFTRLKQVLLNLMSNAIKYNVDGGSVGIGCEEMPGNMLRVSITDTGPGISEKMQEKLFQPFSRLGAENSDIEGTGIGLVVCKDLMGMMGGTIGYQSNEGSGSTFWFELPVSEAVAETIPESVIPSDDKTLQQTTGTMLYVEDNPSNLQLMEMIVSRIDGLEMLSAHTAELGIEIARSRLPDMIILDINLPGMSGVDAIKKLRQLDETKNIPTIALSAAATRGDISKGLDAGFDRYLTKPLQVDEITRVIHEFMND